MSDVFVSYVRSDKTHVAPRRVCNSGGARTPRWPIPLLDVSGEIQCLTPLATSHWL
jgi:hypothetical protein